MASTRPVDTGFQRVLARFSSRLTREEEAEFRFTTLDEVHQAIVNIQARQASRKGMRNLTRVLAFVEAMDQFGKVVEVFLNVSNILAFVWGPLKFLLQVTSNWAESFDTLLDAYQQIAENIPLFLQYQTLFEHSPHISKVLEMIYEDILEFHQSALRMFGKSTLEQVFRAAWKTFKSRFQHILQDLQRHKLLIESQANALEIQAAQAARSSADEAFKQIFLARQNTQYSAAQDWLSAVNMRVDYEGYSAIRQDYPSTGKWLLTNDKIKTWLDPDNSTVSKIWLNGIPGAGKTILASLLIEEVQEISGASAVFFYCKHKDPQRSTFLAVARAILSQLLVGCRENDLLTPFLYEQSLDSGESTLHSMKLCNSLLKTAFAVLPEDELIYIIIDGIDECEPLERKEIISTFSSIITETSRPARVRGLFVSQDEKDIKTLLRTAASIRISESDIEDDIKYFSDHWASKISLKFKLPPDRMEQIARTVCHNADGMFLYVKLVMTNLYNQTTRGQLYAELQKQFPRGLDQAYKRIVERIFGNENEAEREQAQKLLGWLVCARRPLKWHEIQGAMSIDVEGQTVDFEYGQLVLDVQELCGSLVERLSGDRIELVHSTAKFYLIQKNQENSYIRMEKEEGRLAALCLSYLTFESLACEPESDDKFAALVSRGSYAFLDYATLHWVDHLEEFLKTMEREDLGILEAVGPISEDFDAIYGSGDTLEEENASGFEVRCEEAREQSSFPTFVSLITNARQARSEQEDLPALGALGSMQSRVRQYIESLVESSRLAPTPLHRYYGYNCFKCPRHLCFYFHEGFPDARSRERHLSRHDRPFCCTYDGCSRVQTGFSSEKELKIHLKKIHPDPESLSWSFQKPQKTSTPGIDGQRQRNPATFQCTLCPRRFTRAHSLRSHLRTHLRTHTAERPFVCTVCGKAFARQNDRKRHEGLHSGEKKFVCKGELKQGGQWGCGRRFPRLDALSRHQRSEAGGVCIKPLLDEEKVERQHLGKEKRAQNTLHMPHLGTASEGLSISGPNNPFSELLTPPTAWPTMQPTGQASHGLPSIDGIDPLSGFSMATSGAGNQLPAALLAQYPALRQVNWSEEVNGSWDILPVGEQDAERDWLANDDGGINSTIYHDSDVVVDSDVDSLN